MRRASLAIGVALNPGILLLDEPTANLDIATRREILSVLEDMKGIIQTAVIATTTCSWCASGRPDHRPPGQGGGRRPRDEVFRPA